MVVEYISNTDECRRLARNVVTGDFDNNAIISWQKKVYSDIATKTDKDDWASTDREFGALQAIETEIVASYIIEHFGEPTDIPMWQAMRASGMDALMNPETGIVANMDTETPETDALIERTDYKGWGYNPNIKPPNRLERGVVSDIEGF